MSGLAPPMPYFGGKQMLAPKLAALFPKHGHYVEPYCGSLAVLLAKPTSRYETVNDIDGQLMTFWRVLRDRPSDLERVCALTPHSRAEQAAAYEPATDDLEVARRVWVQLTQGRAGIRRSTGWRHYVKPVGTAPMSTYLSGYVDRIAAAAERLHHVSLENRPALDVIERYGRDAAGHADLLIALSRCKASIVLSGYPSSLYDEQLGDWHRMEWATMTGQGGANEARTEVAWTNFDPYADAVLDFGEAS